MHLIDELVDVETLELPMVCIRPKEQHRREYANQRGAIMPRIAIYSLIASKTDEWLTGKVQVPLISYKSPSINGAAAGYGILTKTRHDTPCSKNISFAHLNAC